MADVAWAFHFPPSELRAMTLPQLMFWHRELRRIQKQLAGKSA